MNDPQATKGTVTQHKNVHVAMAAAKALMGPVVKGAKNPHFKTNYADLSDVVNVVRLPLTSNGLDFSSFFEPGSNGIDYWTTVITHGESETNVRCPVPLHVQQSNMQGFKSAVTYARRIGLEGLTGVAPEDDDGNAAAAAPRQERAPERPTPPRNEPRVETTISADQAGEITELAAKAGAEVAAILKWAKVEKLDDLPAYKFSRVIGDLNARMPKAKPPENAKNADVDFDDIPY